MLCLTQVPDFCKDKTEREYKRESRTVRRTRDWTAHDMITVYCAKAYDPEFKFHWTLSHIRVYEWVLNCVLIINIPTKKILEVFTRKRQKQPWQGKDLRTILNVISSHLHPRVQEEKKHIHTLFVLMNDYFSNNRLCYIVNIYRDFLGIHSVQKNINIWKKSRKEVRQDFIIDLLFVPQMSTALN